MELNCCYENRKFPPTCAITFKSARTENFVCLDHKCNRKF